MTTDHAHPPTGLAEFIDALRPLAQAAARALADLAHALRQAADYLQTAAPVHRDRPAWATPYGPPPRRRR
ncbi:hypothetical protein ACH4Q7_22505 [Streptomyces roseolus]|uniref:hypothetical protein n=1 Tax=Streptomyces roseolus TaxID=67358 RepID=UPI003795833D